MTKVPKRIWIDPDYEGCGEYSGGWSSTPPEYPLDPSVPYVPAEIADGLLAALEELVGDACLDFSGEPIGFVKARAAIAKAKELKCT